MLRRPFLIFLLCVALAVVLFACIAADDKSDAATTCPATTVTRTGNQTSDLNQSNNGGTWNLTGATWNKVSDYPVRSSSWSKGCLLGSTVIGRIPRSNTRDQWYNGVGGTEITGDAYALTLTSGSDNWAYQRDSYVTDVEDAYDPNGTAATQMVTLDHVRAEYVRDDCLENEGSTVASVTISNSLLDGCFTAFAERPSGASTAQNGTGAASFTVTDSLVYVQPQPLGSRYCDSSAVTRGRCKTTGTSGVWLGAYGIWKWSTAAAKTVTVRNTVFRLDMPSYSSCSSQKWPAGTYQNVTLVWTGPGSYATAGDCANVLPAGVTLTTDVSVWDNAKAAWLAGGTTPTPTPTPTPSPTPSTSPSPTPSLTPTPTPTSCG